LFSCRTMYAKLESRSHKEKNLYLMSKLLKKRAD
jgi:hypothetical protein